MARLTTIVLTRDGKPHLMSDKLAQEDAVRWAEEGYLVFMVAVDRGRWVVKHSSGRVLTDESQQSSVQEVGALLSKGKTS